MKEFFRKYSLIIYGLFLIGVINWFFIFFFNAPIITTSLTAFVVALLGYKLVSARGTGERRLLQRLELRKRTLECFEEINKLILKIKFYKTTESYDYKDIGISFEQIRSYFVELQKVYKKLPGDVALIEKVEKLMEFYDGWEKYFLLERPEDLQKFKNSIKDAEGYLDCLSKALLEYTSSLQLE